MSDQLTNRDLAIAAARKGGLGLRRIGAAFGISHTQVRRILARLARINESSTFRSHDFPAASRKLFKGPHGGPTRFRACAAL